MEPFKTLTSTCFPIQTENIDTDQIIPARFLKTTSREGLGQFLFNNWRFDDNGKPIKTSPFWNGRFNNAKILVAGNNFGCGSSREHAVWAILDYGFRVVISSSFGDIFYNNSLKNSLLPIVISALQLQHLFRLIHRDAQHKVTIDLKNQQIIIPSSHITYDFFIDQFRKICLMNGTDELGFILSQENKISEFEKSHKNFLKK